MDKEDLKQQDVRRRAFRHQLEQDKRFEGVVNRFAIKFDTSQSVLSGALSGRKSFGARLARKYERLAGWQKEVLEREPGSMPQQVADPRLILHGLQITREEAELGIQWGKLNEPLRGQYARLIEMAVAAQVETPTTKQAKSKRRGKRDDDRPRPAQ